MNFSFYMVDSDYCDYLRKSDPCVPYTMDKKSIRPFVGIVFTVNGFQYYAPLTSPKPKHLKMKNQIDFMKIKNGEWGAINFNNMIPVSESCLKKVEMNITDTDNKSDIDYKNLLKNQLSWCNSNKEIILKQAEKLYYTIIRGEAWENLAERCCNFSLDEKQCQRYENGEPIIERKTNIEQKSDDDKRPSVLEKLNNAKQEAAAFKSAPKAKKPHNRDVR